VGTKRLLKARSYYTLLKGVIFMNGNISDIDYKQVIEYALEPLIIHSQLNIIDINSAAEVFFRASKTNIIGASPLDIFKDTSKAAIEKRIQAAYEQPAKVIEETIYRMDGTTVDVELYCHPVQMGDTKAIQTYVRDITERKLMEKKQQEISKQINELSFALVPLLDATGTVLLALTTSRRTSPFRHFHTIFPICYTIQSFV
jgi:rsbT co-antagonist protein RsbR